MRILVADDDRIVVHLVASLLRAKGHEGSGALSAAAYIRRSQTNGGAAPKTGCDQSHLADQARMRYTATYQFFGAAKNN